jgi:hypothetical protein
MTKLSANHLFDAVQAFQGPHAIPVQRNVSTLSIERLASFLEAGSSGLSRVTAGDLTHAIRHTFDLNRDRIVADPTNLLDLPTVPIGRRVRFDVAHQPPRTNGQARSNADPAPQHRTVDSGTRYTAADSFSAALGVARAREVLLDTNWIVVVVDARSVLSPPCQQQLNLLARQERVLIIWCEMNSTIGNPAVATNRQRLDEMLARGGLSQLGPLSVASYDDLVCVLQALKLIGPASLVVLRVRDDDAAEPDVATPSAPDHVRTEATIASESPDRESEIAPQNGKQQEPTVEAMEASLVRVVSREPQVMVIDPRAEQAQRDLSESLGKRYMTVAGDDPYLWQWCAGLVSGGCRPLVLIDQRQWTETAAALAALSEEVELPATVIVFAGRSTSSLTSLTPSDLGFDARVVAADDVPEFETLLASFLHEQGLTVIWATARQRSSESVIRLRIDPTVSTGEVRDTRSENIERQLIVGKQFSEQLSQWVAAYEQVGQRGGYIWKWCLHGVELTTLSCVRPLLRADVCDTKVLAGMFNVLIDDAADRQGHEALLAELFKLTNNEPPRLRRFSAAERRYGEFTCDVWSEFRHRTRRYPCYDPYAALLQFDLAQLFNTVRYSHLVNSNPYILNVVEHDDYSPQGMGLLSFAMVDLMCSPDFSVTDLGRLREAMWHAQWMARIGNLITTWQREVLDRDYTSGVFAHAVSNYDLSVEQLLSADPKQIAAVVERGGHEAYFLRRWKQHRGHIERLQPHVTSVHLGAMLCGLDRLLQTELISRGEK